MLDGFQADNAVEALGVMELFGVGAFITQVGQLVMLAGVGNGRRVNVHASNLFVRVALGQQGGAITATTGHIQHALAAQVVGGELVALHVNMQAGLVIRVLRVEVLRVNPFDGMHGHGSAKRSRDYMPGTHSSPTQYAALARFVVRTCFSAV